MRLWRHVVDDRGLLGPDFPRFLAFVCELLLILLPFMPGRSLQFVTIFLTCFIDILGFGIIIPVLPLYAEHFGATALQIGWLVGIFSLAQFFFAPIWGRLSDRVGRKPVLLCGVLGTVAGYLLMGLANSVAMLFVARLIDGISGANIGVAQAYLADISSPENRARAMGLLGAAFGLGFVFGPALGGWAGVTFNYSAPMYIAGGLAMLNFVFVMFCLPESRPPQAGHAKREPLFPHLFEHVERRTYAWSLASYFLVVVGFSMMTAIFALLLLHRFGLDALHTGYILAGIGLLGAIIQGGLIGRLVRRFGEACLAFAGALFMCLGLCALALSEGLVWMVAATVAIGIGNSLLMPTLSALASRSAEAGWQGRALGVMQSSGSLARWVGPMMMGFLLSAQLHRGSGAYGLWPLLASSAFLFAAALALFRLGGRGARPSALG
jgi:DHA1 family tetracycline resistance protein-like MFS transporter